jgi:hypothetical protein
MNPLEKQQIPASTTCCGDPESTAAAPTAVKITPTELERLQKGFVGGTAEKASHHHHKKLHFSGQKFGFWGRGGRPEVCGR